MFQAKNEIVRSRQLKVQQLVIPFAITASATASAVVLRNDEPAVLFLKSEGVNYITTAAGALVSGETATYSVAPNDANGILNLFVKIAPDDEAVKVLGALMVSRATGVTQPVKLGDADGISSEGNIMLTLDSAIDHTTTDVDACLIVYYVVAE